MSKDWLVEECLTEGVLLDKAPNWAFVAREAKLFAQPRIFDDLLSSQPLRFNLFGELTRDLALASRVMHRLLRRQNPGLAVG
jgi:hypothetical protein